MKTRQTRTPIKKAKPVADAIFNSILDAALIIGPDFRVIKMNKASRQICGSKPGTRAAGGACYELFHNRREPVQGCPHAQVFKSKKPAQFELFEPRLEAYFEVSLTPIFDKNGDVAAVVHIARDVSSLRSCEQKLHSSLKKFREAQAQLIQTDKMATMGKLVAGICHELNQPLTGIKGFAQAVNMDLSAGSPLKQDMGRIVEQADRMDKIINNIRVFIRKSPCAMEDLDVNPAIEASLMLLQEQLRVHSIRLKKELACDLPKIKGDFNQLQQVFLNLITNARDALDSLKGNSGKELSIRSALSSDKKSIEVVFKDTGCGIPRENLQHIFNAFFTTKSPEKGMGLGLSIVSGILENHGGRIEVESEPAKGSTFRISFPVVNKSDQITPASSKKPGAAIL